MFSLIITIISIALVAALALATIYYGGSAFENAAAEAQAAKYLNQGAQLQGAFELYAADPANSGEPATLELLVSKGYLKAIPVAQLSGPANQVGLSVALAGDAEWRMPQPGVPVFEVTASSQEACLAYNRRASLGQEEVLGDMDPSLIAQCYAADGDYVVVQQKKVGDLETVIAAAPGFAVDYVTIFAGGGQYPLYKSRDGAGPTAVDFRLRVGLPGMRIAAAWLKHPSDINSGVACGVSQDGGKAWTGCVTSPERPLVHLSVYYDGGAGAFQHEFVDATAATGNATYQIMTTN